ncbi:MAG: hypothetical protein ACR2PL_17470 [Dehalococcoidia bacterium]
MLLAFLPSLSFLGHWDEVFSSAIPDLLPAAALFDGAAEQAERAEHANHCHTDLASCSAQPLPAGLGLLATHETHLPTPLLHVVRADWPEERGVAGRVIPPSVPPPRGLFASPTEPI